MNQAVSKSSSGISRSRCPRQRYLRVSWTMMPLSNNNDKRFGIAIRAFMQSARFHTIERLAMLPKNTAIM